MAARRFVLSLDQGTTSTRAIVFDAHGSSVSSAQREHRQIFPASGHVEHDPEEIWTRTNEVIAEALSRAGAAPGDLASLGITNQRETLVVWHRDTGRAYHNAIVWQDVRGAALCESLAAASPRAAERFRAQTGLPLVPYFTASKLAWCLDNVPGLREDAEKGVALAGTIDSFLVWRLTRPRDGGGAPLHVTDVTNASRTLLFNIHTLAWDAELCRAFKVPMAMLPRVLPSRCVPKARHAAHALSRLRLTPHPRPQPRVRHVRRRLGVAGGVHWRHPGRPAGGAVWAGVLFAGRR